MTLDFVFSGGLGGLGGGFGGLSGLGGLGGLGGGLGAISGVPIGFGVTTTVGGLNPYTDDLYGGNLGYGPSLGYAPARGAGGIGGVINRALNRGPYRRPY